MKRLALTLHWMNFDTALGAAATSLFIANNICSVVPPVVIIALALAVLAIYNFDHLLDAKKINGVAISGRHKFYQQYFNQLAIYQVCLLISLLVISWFVPAALTTGGLILAVITLAYFIFLFIIIPHRFVLKELIIALVFSSGVFLGPMSGRSTPVISLDIVLLWLEIFFLAMANTLIFAWLDYEHDRHEGHSSLAQILGSKLVFFLSFVVLIILVLLISLSLANDALWNNQLVILAMSLVLFISLFVGQQHKLNERVRIACEAIFLIPLASLLF